MQFEMLYSKIHRARVSDANLHYSGSITIYKELAHAAGMLEGMKVDVVNVNNGDRFSTYVIFGDQEGYICLNGAAARRAIVGDVIIIIAYAQYGCDELKSYAPKIVLVDERNRIISIKKEV